jgi:hypothetical protein
VEAPTKEPETLEDALQFAKEAAAAAAPKASKPRGDDGKFLPATDKPKSDTTAVPSEGAKAVEDKGAEATPAAPGTAEPPAKAISPDLSFLPEDIRSEFQTLSPKAADALKKGWLQEKDATKKWQEAAELRKQAEAFKANAELWDRLASRPEAMRAAMKVLEGGEAPSESAEVDPDTFDFTQAPDNAAIVKAMKALVRKMIAAEAPGIADARVDERLIKPATLMQKRQLAVVALGREAGYTKEQLEDAIGKANDHYAALGGPTWDRLDPEKAQAWVTPFLPAKAATNGKSTHSPLANPLGDVSRVAAPGTGANTIPPFPEPEVVRSKKPIAKMSPSELEEYTAHLLREKLGTPITVADLRGITR